MSRPPATSRPRSRRPGRRSAGAASVPGVDVRVVAADLVGAVLSEHRALDEAIAASSGFARLSERDRAFARLIAVTVLRRKAGLDRAIAGALNKPLAPKAAPVMQVLRCGLAQLWHLDTPAYAAIGTAVGAVEALRFGGFKGLVNAVLRTLSQRTADQARPPGADAPDWLFDRWSRAYGPEAAHAIARAHRAEPPLDLTVKAGGEAAAWADRLDGVVLPTGVTIRRPVGGAVTALPGYAEGAWWVQDAGAALPALLLGDVAGRTVLDLCAAPGGKTAQLAAAGARVIAVDRSRDRLVRLDDNLRRLGLRADTVVADLTRWQPDAPADRILLDAPCTATGTIRRHPDLQWLKRPQDIDGLAAVQAQLLDRAARWLAPGGVLVWCTCSLEPEEGPAQIDRLLANRPDIERVPITADEIGGWSSLLTPAGDVRSRPDHLAEFGGIDGFHISRLHSIA